MLKTSLASELEFLLLASRIALTILGFEIFIRFIQWWFAERHRRYKIRPLLQGVAITQVGLAITCVAAAFLVNNHIDEPITLPINLIRLNGNILIIVGSSLHLMAYWVVSWEWDRTAVVWALVRRVAVCCVISVSIWVLS